jgi:hypothetical protein
MIGGWDRDSFQAMAGYNKPIPGFSTLYDNSVINANGERFRI